jgi:hypothetical protein
MIILFFFEFVWEVLKWREFWVITAVFLLAGVVYCLIKGTWEPMLAFSASPFFALLVVSAIIALISYAAYDRSKYED